MDKYISQTALIDKLKTAITLQRAIAQGLGVENDPEIQAELKAYTDILNGVKESTTIDAVQVVRCKECTYYSCHQKGKPWKVERPYCNRSVTMATEPDDYCSRGERQEV